MQIRKITYNLVYIHVLTFSQLYKPIIAPYFGFEGIRYSIENENSIHETVRLDFSNESIAMVFRKEGCVLIYEGAVADVKRSNPIIDIFYDIYEKIKKMDGFVATKLHKLIVDAVIFEDNRVVEEQFSNNKFFTNPFGTITEFATISIFEKQNKQYRFQFGNYNDKDIEKFDLSPLKSQYNKELIGKVGFLCQVTVEESITNSTFSRFKTLISDAETVINIHNQILK